VCVVIIMMMMMMDGLCAVPSHPPQNVSVEAASSTVSYQSDILYILICCISLYFVQGAWSELLQSRNIGLLNEKPLKVVASNDPCIIHVGLQGNRTLGHPVGIPSY